MVVRLALWLLAFGLIVLGVWVLGRVAAGDLAVGQRGVFASFLLAFAAALTALLTVGRPANLSRSDKIMARARQLHEAQLKARPSWLKWGLISGAALCAGVALTVLIRG